MRMKFLLIVVILLPHLALAQTLPADPTPTGAELLDRYRMGAFSTRFELFKGLVLSRSGQDVDVGFFGGNAEELFGESPRAMEDMTTFTQMRTVGTTFYAVGLGALLTELVLLPNDSGTFVSPHDGQPTVVFWTTLVGGAVLGMTGALLMQGANSYLSDAMENYNTDLARRLGGHR